MPRPLTTCPMVKVAGDPCPHILEGVLNLIGRKWSMLVIGTVGNFGRLRFHEIREKLGGVSPKVLAQRLKELEQSGLLAREAYREIPPRVQYSLTPAGRHLRDALQPLLRWSASYDHA